jgi:hypothetical protein
MKFELQREDLMRAPGKVSSDDPITETVAEVVGQWREISEIPCDLQAFGRAMASMAADFGLSPAELRALAAKDANARQLALLLEALRIDILALAEKEPAVLRDLRRSCTVCDQKLRCDRDMAAKAQVANFYAYCANAAILKKLQRDARFARTTATRIDRAPTPGNGTPSDGENEFPAALLK